MILVDLSGIIFGHVVNEKLIAQEDLIRHTILNTLRSINAKFRGQYGQIVLCCDGGSWREQIFPEYKWARKQGRVAAPAVEGEGEPEETGFDWVEIFRIINTLLDEFKTHLQWPVVQVRWAEADDVIAVLEHYHMNTRGPFDNEKILIVSRDRDFFQLHKPDVFQYDPFTQKYVTGESVAYDLFVKCVKGDGGDGIPNILAPQDFFVQKAAGTQKRQPTISAKKLADWYKNGIPPELKSRYDLNCAVINLTTNPMPQDIWEQILREFETQRTKTNANTLSYLVAKNCRNLIERLTDF